jgi:acetyltransferase-like isoleucine patch superfamily enzyme
MALFELFKARPLPHFICAIYLCLRWRCFVSPDCRIYYPFNIVLGRGARLIGRVTLIANGEIRIGSDVEMFEGAFLHCQNGSIDIGDHTAIGPNVTLYGTGGLRIGSKCSIAAETTVVSSSHRFERLDVSIREQGNDLKETVIEDDVWIAAGVTIAYGTTVGRGAVIGANSFVCDDVPSMSIVAGVPARMIRLRS